MVLENLEPKRIFDIFEHVLAQTPRESKKEEKIREVVITYLETHAKQNNISLNIHTDAIGNILISRPASLGMEDRPPLLFQGHLDMVCETDRPDGFDFDNLPIPIRIQPNGEWIDADGTTLGADNGIGVAIAMALLLETDPAFVHGPFEVLLTVDEETGLTGAFQMDVEALQIKSKLLINVDSEETGIITIGSAGGGDTTFKKSVSKISAPAGIPYTYVTISIAGLYGGHSGGDIHLPRGSANKLMARLLSAVTETLPVHLCEWNGGTKHNAITRNAVSIVAVPQDKYSDLEKILTQATAPILAYYHDLEPNLAITWQQDGSVSLPFFPVEESRVMIQTVHIIPHGALRFSPQVAGLVETSNNLAIVKTTGDTFSVKISSRSNVDEELVSFRRRIAELGQLAGWIMDLEPAYPGWAPDPNSAFLHYVTEKYAEELGSEIKVEAIHAGLESGIIGDKISGMQMLSIGPTIRDCHTPEERAEIKSVSIMYSLFQAILKDLPAF
ncbi:MAG: beta-Ala-His dipeptidase [Promethearchaeota archaeon]